MTQSYGPEARGGAASASLIISDEPILYPYLTQPGILVVMSQESYSRFTPELKIETVRGWRGTRPWASDIQPSP